MQNWKLIGDTAQTSIPADGRNESKQADISDSGFASFSHPKLKFNFSMRITLRVPVGGDLVLGSGSMQDMDIPLKTATRPQPNVVMQDVNYYNYRTKVATKVDYGTATVVMYDDGDGKAHDIYTTYMRAISPASSVTDDTLIHNPASVPFGGMSSLGALPNNPNGIIKSLSVYHHYISRGRQHRTEYKYINPKILSFDLDELNMSESDVSCVGMTFAYDSVVVSSGSGPKPSEYDQPVIPGRMFGPPGIF